VETFGPGGKMQVGCPAFWLRYDECVVTAVLTTGTVDEFFARSLERARKLDRGERIPAEIRVVFEDPADLMQVLSTERIRVLHAVRARPIPVSQLASGGHARCAATGIVRIAEDAGRAKSGARTAENRRAVGRQVSTGREYLRT